MNRESNRRGVGLYTGEQVKNTTPFQYFAQIVVGAVVCITGLMVAYSLYEARAVEILRYGSPDSHVWGFIAAGVLVVIGVFMGHACVIYWWRRLRTPHDRA